MTDGSLEKEYTTNPVPISDTVAIAPTMEGGLAILVDGEHVDHFQQNELEEMEDAVSEALNVMEHEGHSTASERKFDRFIQEAIGYQAEITHYLYDARQAAENDEYREINYDTLHRVIGMLQNHASMLDAMSRQLQNWKEMEEEDGRN